MFFGKHSHVTDFEPFLVDVFLKANFWGRQVCYRGKDTFGLSMIIGERTHLGSLGLYGKGHIWAY
jgi:hypothetical protein